MGLNGVLGGLARLLPSTAAAPARVSNPNPLASQPKPEAAPRPRVDLGFNQDLFVRPQTQTGKPNEVSSDGRFGIADLGSLSRKNEGNIDTISKSTPRDPGGKSYGAYQFASKKGGLDLFMKTIKDKYPDQYNALAAHKPGSPGFDAAWQKLAKEQPKQFYEAQHYAAAQKWFMPVKAAVESSVPNLDLSKRSKAVNDMVWSMSIQHGKAAEVIQGALKGRDVSKMGDEEMLRTVYAARTKYVNQNKALDAGMKASISNRYKRELADALVDLRSTQK
ncbi:hypothetical protein [Corallococcus exercitus]|uniref:VgrG-related protein n=1 Tax=Corallococcus exercitus TaxID=2316736 RepID=UPI0011C405C6|nr:hypothetical protein [Corallococcus exercitus]